VLLAYVPSGERFQLVERAVWIGSLNVHYLLGVDGLSVLFLPATALLFLGSLVAGWNAVRDAPRLYYSLLLLLQTATLGIFCALDTALFFVFWELTLVPIYFLLGRWGVTAGGGAAATRYFLIMLAGGIPLLLAIVILAASQPVPTFDLMALLAAPLPRSTQTAVFLLCLLGFGVKVPLVPLHTWLPQFALAAPGSLTALLVGLKLGAFGLIRFAVPWRRRQCGSGGRRPTARPWRPSPMAMMICLYGTVVQSPAANTPGTEVWPLASMIDLAEAAHSSTVPFSQSVLGSRPICTKMPSSSTRCVGAGVAVLVDQAVDLLAVAGDFGGLRAGDHGDVGQAVELALQHGVGAQLSANSSSVTWPTMPARSIAASTPELPPPITATRLPLNSGPSQCGQ
jgi:hypothetical protein